MANCADCGQPFAGTPWQYNPAGQRIHCDCNERPPEGALGSPGSAHLYPKPAPNWGTKPARVHNDQIRWRQLARQHAHWSGFARAILKRDTPITPAQGAALDKMERRATGKPRRKRH